MNIKVLTTQVTQEFDIAEYSTFRTPFGQEIIEGVINLMQRTTEFLPICEYPEEDLVKLVGKTLSKDYHRAKVELQEVLNGKEKSKWILKPPRIRQHQNNQCPSNPYRVERKRAKPRQV